MSKEKVKHMKIKFNKKYFKILYYNCDITCQNQINVGICHLPEIKF